MKKKLLFVAIMLATSWCVRAQFTPQGVSVTVPNFNLTPLSTCGGSYEAGALWADGSGAPAIPQFIDFTQCFTLTFQEQFTAQSIGADGFAVVFGSNLTPMTAPNNTDAALGYYNRCSGTVNASYNNSIGIEFDIYDNSYAPCTGDIPGIDHTEIAYNGCYDPVCAGPGGPSVPILPTLGFTSIKDGAFHNYEISWNCNNQILSVLVDGNLRCQGPITPAAFSPLNMVQWGFTGGTGASCSDMVFQSVQVAQSGCINLAAISGPTDICAGSSCTLTDPTAGGMWGCISSIASIDPTGLLTTTGPGVITVSYTMPGAACSVYYIVTAHQPSVTITSVPPAVTGGYIPSVIECGGATLTASAIDLATGLPYTLPCSYSWAPGGGTTSSIVASPLASTVYNVTVTDPFGCTGSDSILVSPSGNPCACPGMTSVCGNPINIFVPSGSISGPVVIGPGFYTMNNPVNITSGIVSLNNCVILVGAGYGINVMPGAKLVLKNCHLYSCSMWKGINLLSAGSGQGEVAVLGNTLIEDATTGINASSPTTPAGYVPGSTGPFIIQTNGAIFNKCNIGIHIDNYNTLVPPLLDIIAAPGCPAIGYYDDQTASALAIEIQNTIFTSRDFSAYSSSLPVTCANSFPLVWPATTDLTAPFSPATTYDPPYNIDNPSACVTGSGYPYISCNLPGVYADRGIDLLNVGTLLAASTQFSDLATGTIATSSINQELNMFDNVGYGIYSNNSDLVIRNSDFQHAQQNPVTGTGGDGIYAVNTSGGQYQLWVYGSNGSLSCGQGGPTPVQSWLYDCINDIEVHDYYSTIAEFATMMSDHSFYAMANPYGSNGILLQSSYYADIQLNYNTIYNEANGINVTATLPSFPTNLYGQITTTGNMISATNTGMPPMLEYMLQGISINNASGSYAYNTVPGCQINANQNIINSSLNGIQVSNFITQGYLTTINNNSVTLQQDYFTGMAGTYAQTGISLTNMDIGGYVEGNNVTGPGYNTPTPPSYQGMLYAGTYPIMEAYDFENIMPTSFLSCNQANNINTGFYIANGATQWINNVMTNCAYGLVLNGMMGPQGSPGMATCDDQWLAMGGFSWTAPNYATYTIGSTNPVASSLYVASSLPGGIPLSNGTDGGPATAYSAPTSIIISAEDQPIPCPQAPPTTVPFRLAEGITQPGMANSASQTYTLFPNPTDGNVTLRQGVQDNKPVMGEIWNSMGQRVYMSEFNFTGNEARLNVSSNPPGLYHIQLVDNAGQRYTIEFIIK
jgi:hypothetical protein